MWTRFMDMHSGGGSKEKWEYIYIEAKEEEAKIIFYNRFGHNPERVTCTCCGDDYSISESKTLKEVTAYDRGCMWKDKKYVEKQDPKETYRTYMTIDEYEKQKDVLFIGKEKIKDSERVGSVPEQGYVWQD